MSGAKKKFRGLWWKIPAGFVCLLLILLIAVILNLNPIVCSQLNRLLNDSLVAGGSLDAVEIDLSSGQLAFSGLLLAPPAGFGKNDVLTLNSFSVAVDPASLFGDVVVVNHLNVTDLALSLVRDKGGHLNLEALLPAATTSGPRPSAEGSSSSFPAILIRSLKIENLSIALRDESSGEQWTGHCRIDLSVDNLKLDDVAQGEIVLGKALLTLSEVHLDQPAGFGPGELLTLKKLGIATTGIDLNSSHLTLDDVSLQGATVAVSVDKNGETNLQVLSRTLSGQEEETAAAKDNSSKPADSSPLPVVTIKEITIADGSLLYRNEMKSDDPLVLQFNAITADVSGLRLFDKHDITKPAAAKLSFEVAQPKGLPTAYFGALATVGPVGEGIPPVNAQLRLYGLKLDTLGARVPPSVQTALGASGLDIAVSLALDDDSIKLQSDVLTDKNIRYTAIKVQGPLNSLRIEVGKFMAGFNRVAGWLNNARRGGLHAGIGLAKTGVDITRDVGTGAYKLGKHLGQNLFDIGTGLVTVDGQKLNKGVSGTTGGTTGQINRLVLGTGSTTAGGLRGSLGNLQGDAAIKAWDDGISARYRNSMEQAQLLLGEMPYPPVTE